MPHSVGNLIDLAVEDDHLAVEIFKCAEAKVAVLQENRRTNRTGVNAFDKSTGGRDLIKRAHFSSGGGKSHHSFLKLSQIDISETVEGVSECCGAVGLFLLF